MNFKKMAKRFFTLSQNHDGFTLVELIVVIAIMAILAGVAVPAYTGYINKANKASDLQLLGAVNTAFAAAAMENGDNVNTLQSAQMPIINNKISLAGIRPEKYRDAFSKYYGDNLNVEFKVIKTLNFVNGVFTDDTEALNNAVNSFNQSNFAGKVETLAGSVDNLAGMLATTIGESGGAKKLYVDGNHMSEAEYNQFMADYGLTDTSSDTEIANATAMYIADKLSNFGAEGIAASGGDMNKVIEEIGTIPTAALAYGLMTGYVNSEYNTTGATLTQNPTGISAVMKEFGEMSQTDEFKAYFNNSDSSKKGSTADLGGIFAAMDVINSYEGSFDLTDEDLFVSEETNALLNSILGSNS